MQETACNIGEQGLIWYWWSESDSSHLKWRLGTGMVSGVSFNFKMYVSEITGEYYEFGDLLKTS